MENVPLYEMVREILNSCPNNQMRDVSFQEVDTDDPEAYVREMLRDGRQSFARKLCPTAL